MKLLFKRMIVPVLFFTLLFGANVYADETTAIKYDKVTIKCEIRSNGQSTTGKYDLPINGLKGPQGNLTTTNDEDSRIKGTAHWLSPTARQQVFGQIDETVSTFSNKGVDGKMHNVTDTWTWCLNNKNGKPNYATAIKCVQVTVNKGWKLNITVTPGNNDYKCSFVNNDDPFWKSAGYYTRTNPWRTKQLGPGTYKLILYFDAQAVGKYGASIDYNFVSDNYSIVYSNRGATEGKSVTTNYQYKVGNATVSSKTPNQLSILNKVKVVYDYGYMQQYANIKNDEYVYSLPGNWDAPGDWNLTPDGYFEASGYKTSLTLYPKWGTCVDTLMMKVKSGAEKGRRYKFRFYDIDSGELLYTQVASDTFDYWDYNGRKFNKDNTWRTAIGSNMVFKANYKKPSITLGEYLTTKQLTRTVSFDTKGGTAVDSVSGKCEMDYWVINGKNYSDTAQFTPTKDEETINGKFKKASITLPKTIPSLKGSVFLGWMDNGKLYKPGDTIEVLYNTVLVAKWKTDGKTVNPDTSNKTPSNNTTQANNKTQDNITTQQNNKNQQVNNQTSNNTKYQVTIKCKKDKKVKGYEVKLSTSKKFKKKSAYYKVSKSKKNKIKFTNLPKAGKYYYKYRTYKKKGKKKVYSAWSKRKKIVVK